ncbi:MAG: GNAT family N-acetyltransferase [Anaerolineae bacterium]|nr:GNAT family N-acetyltransferase [Anaerolineae bacterium]
MTLIAETERLWVRTLVEADWPAVHAWLSDPLVMRFLPDAPYDELRTQRLLRDLAEQAERGNGLPRELGVALRPASGKQSADHLIGELVFHSYLGVRDTYEIGWIIAREHQGRGYATEAARALIDYGFGRMKLHRIVATCNPENAASWRVMQKLGMRREAHLHQAVPGRDGDWQDEYLYAALREDWLKSER